MINKEPIELYEILVPTVRDDGRFYKRRYHKVWDKQVLKITGGLSISKPIIGQWISPSNTLFSERMIPVRIACTKNQIDDIATMTLSYYKQECVLYYKISDTVVFKYK